jgi:WD40 repeat protein
MYPAMKHAVLLMVLAIPCAPAVAVEPIVLRPVIRTGDEDDAPRVQLYHVAWTPDGRTLMAQGFLNEHIGRGVYVFFWDTITWRERMRIGPLRDMADYRYHPIVQFLGDGSRFLIHGSEEVTIHETATGKKTGGIVNPRRSWLRLSVDARGTMIAVFRYDDEGSLEIVQLPGGRKKAGWPCVSDVSDLAFTSDGKYLAVARKEKTVRLYDTATWQRLGTTSKSVAVESIAISLDGKMIASFSGNETVCVWETPSLAAIDWTPRWFRHEAERWERLEPAAIAFSPDNAYLAASYHDDASMIGFWPRGASAPAGLIRVQEVPGRPEETALAFSPDGKYLAGVDEDYDHAVRVWQWRQALRAGK